MNSLRAEKCFAVHNAPFRKLWGLTSFLESDRLRVPQQESGRGKPSTATRTRLYILGWLHLCVYGILGKPGGRVRGHSL